MRFLVILFGVVAFAFFSCTNSPQNNTPQEAKPVSANQTSDSSFISVDLQKYYADYDLDGMFVLYDFEKKIYYVYNRKYLYSPVTPASTFNITTSLICLEEGIVKDEKSVIAYDGVHKSRNTDSNKDLPLETAFKKNIDWVFLNLRKQIGATKLKQWIERMNFGNRAIPATVDTIKTVGDKSDIFWVVPGTLTITPLQQLKFILQLKQDELPFAKSNMDIVKKIMYVNDVNGFRWSGKQGSYQLNTENRFIGWHTGWIENEHGIYFYVNFLQTSNLSHPKIVNAQKQMTQKILADLPAILSNQ